MERIFYLPISVFLFGLMLALIRYFTSQLPIWLGEAGKLVVLFGQLFLPWQVWGLVVAAYLLVGIIFVYKYYNGYSELVPWREWVLGAILWPPIIAIHKISDYSIRKSHQAKSQKKDK